MQAPKLQKITVNMGVGLAKTDSKVLRAATEQLATIAGQQPSVRRARKSIAAFKLREGNPVGVAVTLRGDRGYEFLDRLVSIAIPRIRDFRGLNPRSFDGRGNYSLGVREQIIFPEIDYDAIDAVRGMDITITTSAASDAEAFALLHAFGMPFSADRRPRGFETLDVSGTVEGSSAHPAPAVNRSRPPRSSREDAGRGGCGCRAGRRPRPPRRPRLPRRPRPPGRHPLSRRQTAAEEAPAAEETEAEAETDEAPEAQAETQTEDADERQAEADAAADATEADATDTAEAQAQAESGEQDQAQEPESEDEQTTQEEGSD